MSKKLIKKLFKQRRSDVSFLIYGTMATLKSFTTTILEEAIQREILDWVLTMVDKEVD